MSDVIYTFQGKDITMNVCIQIRAVVDILQENLKITLKRAMLQFLFENIWDSAETEYSLG